MPASDVDTVRHAHERFAATGQPPPEAVWEDVEWHPAADEPEPTPSFAVWTGSPP